MICKIIMEASFHILSLFKPLPQDQYFCFRNTSFREITKQSSKISISELYVTLCNDKSATPDISNSKYTIIERHFISNVLPDK